MEDFRAHSDVAPETLVKRFGGWRASLQSAGFEPERARLANTDEELILELKRVAVQLGRTPSTAEFTALSTIKSGTIARRLGGTWASACVAAGLLPLPRSIPSVSVAGWNRGKISVDIPQDELRYMYEFEGLSATSIATRVGASRTTILRRLRENGIEVKRLHYTMPRETSIETLIYAELERRNVPFAKQQVVDGLWYVDALIPGARIVIECDGEYWHSSDEAIARDKRKTAYLTSRRFKVFRFAEAAIHADVKACVDQVVQALVKKLE